MGVPVNPTRTALGSARDSFAPRCPYWVRWASSTMTTMLSARFERLRFTPGRGQDLLELLNGGHHRPPRAGGQQPAEVAPAVGLFRSRETAQFEGSGDLIIQLFTGRSPPRWSGCLTWVHGAALWPARAWSATCPNHWVCQTTPPRSSRRLPSVTPVHRSGYRPVLLVAGELLD